MDLTKAFIPYKGITFDEDEMLLRAAAHYEYMNLRRTLRDFSDRPVPKEIIKDILMTAATAPSGAHKQPWTFCAVSNQDMKKKVIAAAEAEEYTNYHGRMSAEWLKDLEPFGTDWHKPFLEIAPWLIVVFRKSYDVVTEGKKNNYYTQESVGIACGFLLEAIHHAGLVALTHTPSPMNFLAKLLERPANEKPYLLIPVGYPAEGALVPDLKRKGPEEVIEWFE